MDRPPPAAAGEGQKGERAVIESLDAALLELQSALSARALYPASHPRVREKEARAFARLRDQIANAGELTLLGIDERVIFRDQTLPSSRQLAATLFRRLHAAGVDRITFGRGLTEPELAALLDSLAETDARRKLAPSPNIRLGFVSEPRGTSSTPAKAVPLDEASPASTALSAVVRDVWSDLRESSRLKTDLLGDVVGTVSKMLHDSSSAMLPLAAVKRHDEYTFVHTINVAVLSTALAEAVGFKDRLVHELNMAALLHDVGKQLIPHELLNKAGKFTDEEFERVRRHPLDGARLLLATPGASELSVIVAYEHHVRADGTGYPKVPRGWKLNLASRVVQMADVFDALRTHRPYRAALPLPKIMRLMHGDVGSMFDADLLEVFFREVVGRGIPEPTEPETDRRALISSR
jgi:HD-GYP domain-containing protein (c-di-GMP phosphodiesterase class II)